MVRGSLSELETQLLIAERLRYLEKEFVDPLLAHATEVGRLIHGLSASISRRTAD
jgi:four helix bundle protein